MSPFISEPLLYSTMASHLTEGSHSFPSHKSCSTIEHRDKVWLSVFLRLLMEAQALRRLIETIYVFKHSPSARMHVFGYLNGLFFYTAAPLSLSSPFAPEVFKFATNWLMEFIAKGKNQIPVTEFDLVDFVNPLMRLRWYAWIGAAIFFWGWIQQLRCHAILGSLRESTKKIEDYIIPRGDWFEVVSSPHYLAEIVIYGGLVVASGGSDLTIWLIFGFVVANLVFAAAETQIITDITLEWKRTLVHYLRLQGLYSNRGVIFPFMCNFFC